MEEEQTDNTIGEVGKFRAEESIAAIQSHGYPTATCIAITVAHALYMLGAIASNLDEDEQKEQLQVYLDRLPFVLEDIKKERAKYAATSSSPAS
jgi:hypothetical protein